MPGQVRERDRGEYHAQRNQRRVDGLDEEQAGDALHVRHDLTAAGHNVGQVRELRIDEHDLCHGFGGGRGVAHRDAEIGLLDGERIVDAVSGHGDHVITGVQRLDDRLLLVGQHAADHIDVLQHAGELVDVLRQRARVDGMRLAVSCKSHFGRDRADGDRVVAGDDAAAHALIAEPCQCGLRIVAHALRTQYERDRLGVRQQFGRLREP